MTSASSSIPSSAFATAEAGSEYFATTEHYQRLAQAIVDALRRHGLVVVTGDPPANPSKLVAALREVSAPRAVIDVSCSPSLDCRELLPREPVGADEPVPIRPGEKPVGAAPPAPIFVCVEADRLTDDQIAELCRTVAQADPAEPVTPATAVLLARSGFVTRTKGAEFDLLAEGLAAHLPVQHLERDEVEPFIRHQLPPGAAADLLTGQRIALIALTSGGDPAEVNRLGRRMLDIEPDVAPSPLMPPRRYAFSRRLLAAVAVCVGVVWLAASALEPQHLDALVEFVRDRILPRNEASEAPHSVREAPAPSASVGSSSTSFGSASVPPSAAVVEETTTEPTTMGSLRLSASEAGALVERGDAFLGAGDIVSARLFFERAADGGDGRAAMRMAVTYDAALLERAGVHLAGDPERAAFWYQRARELGKDKAGSDFGGFQSSGSAGSTVHR
jgi:hypothetical protein